MMIDGKAINEDLDDMSWILDRGSGQSANHRQ